MDGMILHVRCVIIGKRAAVFTGKEEKKEIEDRVQKEGGQVY